MAKSYFKWVITFIYRHPKYSLLIFFLILCTLLPLRLPMWLSYKKVSLSETFRDLEPCLAEVSQPYNEFCIYNFETIGNVRVHIQRTVNISLLRALEKRTLPGGAWRPKDCCSLFRVAVLVPYRDRTEQLKIFLQHIHPFLQKQKLDYQIFIVEQSREHGFNRGKLFNIGFRESLKLHDFCCFILHDVDLLPESQAHIYSCSKMPRHMSSAIDIFRYVLPYPSIFGGVVAISRQHFSMANGFSNQYFGWGAEDDDFFSRIKKKGLDIIRWDSSISRFSMLPHKKADPNPQRMEMLNNKGDSDDGLSDLEYKVLGKELRPLYTWIHVNVKPS